MKPESQADWNLIADDYIQNYFPTVNENDVLSVRDIKACIADAMQYALGVTLPNEPMGDWVPIGDVNMGERVVAPYNKGLGYMVGVVKIDPYGTGKRVVSNGESFVTPEAVKRLLNIVKTNEPTPREQELEAQNKLLALELKNLGEIGQHLCEGLEQIAKRKFCMTVPDPLDAPVAVAQATLTRSKFLGKHTLQENSTHD
jgi:hypothetical protein